MVFLLPELLKVRNVSYKHNLHEATKDLIRSARDHIACNDFASMQKKYDSGAENSGHHGGTIRIADRSRSELRRR